MYAPRVYRLLRELGFAKDEQQPILAEASAAAAKAGKNPPTPFLNSILVWVFLTLILNRLTMEAISGWPGIAKGIVALCMFATTFMFTLWYRGNSWWSYYQPHLNAVLESRGHRLCMHCGYDLRGIAETAQFCPECAAYISKRPIGERGDMVLVDASTLSAQDNSRPLIRGIALSAEQYELISIELRRESNKRKQASTWRGALSWLILVASLVLLFATKSNSHWNPSGWFVAAVWILVPLGMFAWIAMMVRKQQREYRRRFRAAARSIGIEVCLSCGQYLGDTPAQHCPACNAARVPMPQTVNDAATVA